jgi:hypothetical protein
VQRDNTKSLPVCLEGSLLLSDLLRLLTSQEGIENLYDLFPLRRREFLYLAEPPPEARVLSPAVALYLF